MRRRRLPPFLGGGWLRVGGRFDGDPILRGGGIVARRRGDAGGGIGGGFHSTGGAATHDALLRSRVGRANMHGIEVSATLTTREAPLCCGLCFHVFILLLLAVPYVIYVYVRTSTASAPYSFIELCRLFQDGVPIIYTITRLQSFACLLTAGYM